MRSAQQHNADEKQESACPSKRHGVFQGVCKVKDTWKEYVLRPKYQSNQCGDTARDQAGAFLPDGHFASSLFCAQLGDNPDAEHGNKREYEKRSKYTLCVHLKLPAELYI